MRAIFALFALAAVASAAAPLQIALYSNSSIQLAATNNNVGITNIPCDACKNALPLIQVIDPKKDCPVLFQGLCKLAGLQNICGGFVTAIACSFVLPIIQKKDPATVCANLKCVQPANPMPNFFPMQCSQCLQIMKLIAPITPDQCMNLAQGICTQNNLPCTPAILSFACATAMPLIQMKDPNVVCMQKLQCVNPTTAPPAFLE